MEHVAARCPDHSWNESFHAEAGSDHVLDVRATTTGLTAGIWYHAMPIQWRCAENMDVVTLGETLYLINSPVRTSIDRASQARLSFAGAESNVAIGLARLGHSVRWLSAVGDDPFGRAIVKTLRGEGVDVSHAIIDPNASTAVMLRSQRAYAEPEVFYYRTGSACSRLTGESFTTEALDDAEVLFISGITPALSEGCRELIVNLAKSARQHGRQVWFDPNYRSKLWSQYEFRATTTELLRSVDVVLTGMAEGQMLTGGDTPADIANRLRDREPLRVIIKAGAEGGFCFDAATEKHASAFALREIVDPIGAGDGFVAGVMSATLDGMLPTECLLRGNAVGAMVCMAEGDWEGLPTRAELARFLSGRTESQR